MTKTLNLIAIRCLFLFFILFVLFFNNGAFNFLDIVMHYFVPLQKAMVFWVGEHILHRTEPIDPQFNGSGDTSYFYVLLLVVLLLSILGTIIWSAIDYKWSNHKRLFYWLVVVLRYYVGFMLIHYAVAKLHNGQFPSPSVGGMSTTYGDSSPMGLAWRFMGYSDGYKHFMFVAEMMGALLLFRKTTTIGAFLSLMTCLNIMLINYFFDVPVKMLSTALVVMCLIILSPNIVRLFRFFFMGMTVGLDQFNPPSFNANWQRVTVVLVKYVAIVFCALIPLGAKFYTIATDDKGDLKKSLYGAYRISKLTWTEGTPAIDSLYVSKGWNVIGFDSYDRAIIKYGDNETIYAKSEIQLATKSMKFSFWEKPDSIYNLTYESPKKDSLVLKGILLGKPVVISLKRKEFELTKRKFRWVNEYPYNR
ncbi:MAG: hypothetical protein H7223_14095 [Pedobacter sp.]|nr:hypothetical protein [Pedobacter sp.]